MKDDNEDVAVPQEPELTRPQALLITQARHEARQALDYKTQAKELRQRAAALDAKDELCIKHGAELREAAEKLA